MKNFNKHLVNKRDFKHNDWKIKNDLSWIFEYENETYDKIIDHLYWFDIDLKNCFFPWLLKIERELKSMYIYFYKKEFNSENSDFLFNLKFYKKNLKRNFVFDNNNEIEKTIDGVIMNMKFGEFSNFISCFYKPILIRISDYLNLNPYVLMTVIKYASLIRNAVTHNQTVVKLQFKNLKFKIILPKEIFNFEIEKDCIESISEKASGAIYVIKWFLLKMDNLKTKIFLDNIKTSINSFIRNMENKKEILEYERILEKIFYNQYCFEQILKY